MLIFKTDEDAENYCTLLSLSESSLEFICKNNTVIIKDYQKYMGMKINKKEDFLLELINRYYSRPILRNNKEIELSVKNNG